MKEVARIFGLLTIATIILWLASCNNKQEKETLFVAIDTKHTGVNFNNRLIDNDTLNVLEYEYLYNGGGVGIGDFNNDGLADIILSGNQVQTKIYLNKGDFNFEDITASSGINTSGKWCTGVSIIDINQDGLDDIYISVGGIGDESDFRNLLYINNGDLTFTESAEAYGLADERKSIQAIFFDYDLDGDLDLYLLTNGDFEQSANTIRAISDKGQSLNTDRLYRNDFNPEKNHPVFTNVSAEAGITLEGFGLGVSILDANQDDWPDIYVSNDYIGRDFLYINQQDGTFKDCSLQYFGHMSRFAMGNDVADINNDGLLDIFTVDMLPEDIKRTKLMSLEHFSHDVFHIALKFGYGHQYIRNTLQLNNGNGTFSEIGQLAGVDKTDWSWAPLIADFDNDGWNDIFITNGFGKDINDMDFVKFRKKMSLQSKDTGDSKRSVIDCLYQRPALKVENYAFKNKGNLQFEKVSSEWGFDEKTLSNGAAYVDLDNDGDLDLVVNNINAPASIFKNTLREKDSLKTNYLKLKLKGEKGNRDALGAFVTLYSSDTLMVRYNQPVRGYKSTVEKTLHFGLKDIVSIDSIKIKWPNQKESIHKNVPINQSLTLSIEEATESTFEYTSTPMFRESNSMQSYQPDDLYNDFATQQLLLRKYSNLGPCMAVGDLNNDGLEDVFVGGSFRYPSKIFYQQPNGEFEEYAIPNSEMYEDGGAIIFDANSNGQLDLYVTSGGSERYEGHPAYQDRLYINNNGQLEESPLPEMLTSTSVVTAGDFDGDGFLDLFVGGRIVPGKFPMTPKSYILKNNHGEFSIVTQEVAPFLENIGMVTSAVWTDFDNDNNLDLVVVGEMMPITFLKGDRKKFSNITNQTDLPNTSGLWNSITVADFDNDGDMDFIVGNLGLNTNLQINNGFPLRLDYADFDDNGSIDPIFSMYKQGQYFPVASLDQLQKQLPLTKRKFRYYSTFANSSTEEIISLFEGQEYQTLEAHELQSSYIENLGNHQFKISPLPLKTQIAPINGMLTEDLNGNGFLDVVLVGNNYGTELIFGRYDASFGHVLLNDQEGGFKLATHEETGFFVEGDARSIVKVNKAKKSLVLVSRNNDQIKCFEVPRNVHDFVQPEPDELYAIVVLKDNTKRKIEFTVGNGYLSQSSNKIDVNKAMKHIEFYNNSGELTRKIDVN